MIRMTKQRKFILEELKKSKFHPTADELYEQVRKRLPRISLGTIYRNLEIMNRKGLIRRIDTGDGPHRFDGDLRIHYHTKCQKCGRIADLNQNEIPELDRIQRLELPFDIQRVKIEFEDICDECKRKSKLNSTDKIQKR